MTKEISMASKSETHCHFYDLRYLDISSPNVRVLTNTRVIYFNYNPWQVAQQS